ncbi:MAG: copper resistance protein CopC, partial [Chloroflexi bacterium]|nr:copper resistance protein CopC [Chloroflexota bacterium]
MPRKIFLAIIVVLIAAPIVSAHASLVRADPAPNSILPSAPKQIALTFDEAIDLSFSSVQVSDAARARVDTNFVTLAPNNAQEIRAPLKTLGNGTYSVVWKVLSAADGHITRGVYAFSVGEASAATPDATSESAASETAPLAIIARGVNLFALLALVGAVFFKEYLLTRSLRAVHADESRAEARWMQLAALACALLLASEIVRLALQANLVADGINPQTISQVLFDSRLGTVWILRFILIALAAFLLFRFSPRASILVSVLGALLLIFLY